MPRKKGKGSGRSRGRKKAETAVDEASQAPSVADAMIEAMMEPMKERPKEEKADEELWNAIGWDEVGPLETSPVFDDRTVKAIFGPFISKAWEDGVISSDEMAMLEVLKEKLGIPTDVFERLVHEARPASADKGGRIDRTEAPPEKIEEAPAPPDAVPSPEHSEEAEVPEATAIEGTELEELDDILEELEPVKAPKLPPPPRPMMIMHHEPDMALPPVEERPRVVEPPPQAPPPEKPSTRSSIPSSPATMITLTSHIRDSSRPLEHSFDLSGRKEHEAGAFNKRCPHCSSLIKVNPETGRDSCPVCGKRIVPSKIETTELRKILDMAREAFKVGNRKLARELYASAIARSPDCKEAHFYMQKLDRSCTPGRARADIMNLQFIKSNVTRLDQMLNGGFEVGSQVLLKGPAFSGKEVMLDQIMAWALKTGLPVIYVSSNRAMKDVMTGIIRQLPDFKNYNQEGMVRMYDLFSKHKDPMVLKEGHRIFNIDDREDFKRFQEDLISVQEELVSMYQGGLLIMNSLSPLINQVDDTDLKKFLQVLIAKSKGYRFTNILDMASGVHQDNIVNSVEYLMDGIVEFREQESKYSVRLRGFKQGVKSRDWVEYILEDGVMRLIGSYSAERIL